MIRQSVQIVSGLHRIGQYGYGQSVPRRYIQRAARPGGVTMIAPRRCNHCGGGTAGCVTGIHYAPASTGSRPAGRLYNGNDCKSWPICAAPVKPLAATSANACATGIVQRGLKCTSTSWRTPAAAAAAPA